MHHQLADELAHSTTLAEENHALRSAPLLPLPRPGGLIAWARSPAGLPSPLPSLDSRRTRSSGGFVDHLGWQVGLLPAERLAVDLAARGVTYRHGVGYALHGDRLDRTRAAHLLAGALDDAAGALPDPYLWTLRTEPDASLDEKVDAKVLTMEAHHAGLVPDGMTTVEFYHLVLRSGFASATVATGAASATPQQIAEDTPETLRERQQIRRALRHTANDLRTSRAAQAGALALVAPYLPDGLPVADTAAADAFLARFDAEPAILRSALGASYDDAGSPGNLTRSALFTLAVERWGRAVKSSGHFTYRPARSVTFA